MRILSLTVLLLSACLFSQALGNKRHVVKTVPPCCTVVSSVDISSEVLGNEYAEQFRPEPCKTAVIFKVKDGKACVDPEAEWVKNLIVNMKKTTL